MSRGESNVPALIDAARELLGTLETSVVRPFLLEWPCADGARAPVAPGRLPVLRWLPTAQFAAVPATAMLTSRLVAAAQHLDWNQTYDPEDFGQAFLDGYGWSELIGRRGPVASDRLACGVLLLAPGIEYPPHSHDAEEIYVPLSGTASWWRGDGDWTYLVPGTLVHHPPRMPHAMRAAQQPLLALYAWRGGDLRQKSRIESGTPA